MAARHLTVWPTFVPAGAVNVSAAADDVWGVFFFLQSGRKLQCTELNSHQEGSTDNPERY